MPRHDPLKEGLKQFCLKIAKDRALVQAAGGNISWKTEKTLWIKASGTCLADAKKEQIFIPVERMLLDEALAREDYAFESRPNDGYELRPSIETMLHALMPHKIVAHLHLVDAVALLVRKKCDEEITAVLGKDFKWALLDYHKPGADLARAMHELLIRTPKIQVALLKNHGVIIGAKTILELEEIMQKLINKINIEPRKIDCKPIKQLKKISKYLENSKYEICYDEFLASLVQNTYLYQCLKNSWAICPDHVVFLGAKAVCLETPDELTNYLHNSDLETPFIFIRGCCVIKSIKATNAQKSQLIFYLDILLRQDSNKLLNCLNEEEIENLLNWDSEIYRKKLAV